MDCVDQHGAAARRWRASPTQGPGMVMQPHRVAALLHRHCIPHYVCLRLEGCSRRSPARSHDGTCHEARGAAAFGIARWSMRPMVRRTNWMRCTGHAREGQGGVAGVAPTARRTAHSNRRTAPHSAAQLHIRHRAHLVCAARRWESPPPPTSPWTAGFVCMCESQRARSGERMYVCGPHRPAPRPPARVRAPGVTTDASFVVLQ
jgi:hypothetical protein